jgi:hypothetical protein
MASKREQAPRNRDQDLPPRKGDSIESTVPPERGKGERDRHGPLPEEESYEHEPRDERPKS